MSKFLALLRQKYRPHHQPQRPLRQSDKERGRNRHPKIGFEDNDSP